MQSSGKSETKEKKKKYSTRVGMEKKVQNGARDTSMEVQETINLWWLVPGGVDRRSGSR